MPNAVQIILAVFFPIFLSAFLIMLMSKVARKIGLVDHPDARKQHIGEIPIVGGVSVFFTVLATGLLLQFRLLDFLPIFIGFILVLVGVLDDRHELSAFLRLPVQAAAALLMVYVGGISIESVGSVFAGEDVILYGWVSLLFTIMCSVGVINAINMIDGVDGLSGVIVSLTLLPLLYFCWVAEDFQSVLLLLSFLGAMLSFLYFNARFFRKSALVFMGDAGSMFLGFLIVWFLVKLSQGSYAVLSPVSAGWIFGLPLVDTVSVMVRRVCERRSPFDADRHHLHHKLLDAGFSVNQTVAGMGLIHAAFIIVGVISNSIQIFEPAFFWMFVGIVIIYFLKSSSLVSFFVRLSKHQNLSPHKP